jgi:membrane protease YdiL (CAAX protease family)
MRDVTSGQLKTRQPSLVRGWVVEHPLAAFVGLTYLISWAWWIPFVVAGATFSQGVGWPTQMPGLAGPLVAAVIVTWLADGGGGLRVLWRSVTAWKAGWWWLAVPITLGAGAIGLLVSADDLVAADLTTYSGIAKSLGALATIAVVFVCNGLGEETGWRGFAVPRLLRTRSLTAASLIVAAIWAPWHLPMFFALESFEAFTAVETVGWVIGITAGSFLLTWLFRGSGGSVLLVAVWHTAFNFTSAATPATEGVVAAITSTAVMVAAVAIVIVDRRQRRTA